MQGSSRNLSRDQVKIKMTRTLWNGVDLNLKSWQLFGKEVGGVYIDDDGGVAKEITNHKHDT